MFVSVIVCILIFIFLLFIGGYYITWGIIVGGASEEGDSSSTQDVRFNNCFDDESTHPSKAYSEMACQPNKARHSHYSGSGSESGGNYSCGGSESRSSNDIDIEY